MKKFTAIGVSVVFVIGALAMPAVAATPYASTALKAQLKIAKKILALKKLYAKAPESKKAEIRAKIVAKQEKL